MKKRIVVVLAAGVLAGAVGSVSAQETLQGDQKTACEALLCLAAVGSTPSECASSLRRYFSITASKPSDLRKKRRNFLNLCPSGQPDLVQSLVSGKCNATYQDCGATSGGGSGSTQPGAGQETQAR